MAMDDLFQALRMFQQGAQEYATGSAIRSAAQQVKDIGKIQQDEFAKRQQLEETGKQLALQMSAIGAPAAQIQSAAGAIMPQQLKGPEDFFAQSLQAGNPEAAKELANAGMAYQKFLAKAPLTTAQAEQMKLGWAQLFGMQQAAVAGAGGKTGSKPLEMSEAKNITDLEGDLTGMQQLLRKVETNPGLVGLKNSGINSSIRALVNPEFDVFRKQVLQRFDAYRQRVTGAGASEGELKILESRLPQVNDTPAQFIANMKAALTVGERLRKRTLENYGKSGRDISQFSLNPVTSYGKNLDKLEPQIKQIEAAQDALSELLRTNPDDPNVEKLRSAIQNYTRKVGAP